jgi:hypothetical protein
MNKKYHLTLCELHYTPIHGKTEDSDPNIEGHYLLIDKLNTLDNDIHTNNINSWNDRYQYMSKHNKVLKERPHSVIRNYANIVCNKNYIRPEIAECITLPTEETIVIIKTFWLKIIQRTWRNILKKRKPMIKDPSFILKLQLLGNSYKNIPSLKGMLRL